MCAIAGIVHFGRLDGELAARRVGAMIAVQRRRGPDATALWRDGAAAFGYARLTITGSAAHGAQPFHGARGTLVYNGEIYNYRSLIAAGASTCDGEALLAVLERDGVAGLDGVLGMFAAAYWDPAQQCLLLVRDAFGKKPLYYAAREGSFAFASTIRGLHAALGPFRLRAAALSEYLAFKSVGWDATAFEEVAQVPPGGWLSVSRSGVRSGSWYRIPAVDSELRADPARVRALLAQAIGDRLGGPQRPAVFLSGGLDSSIVALETCRRRPDAELFAIGYAGEPIDDERRYARALARELGRELHEVELVPAEVPALLGDVVAVMEDPVADPITVPTLALARAARAHTRVVLTGDGSDEVWGGYERFNGLAGTADYLTRLALFQPAELGLRGAPPGYAAGLDPAGRDVDAVLRFELANRLRNYHLPRVDKLLMDSAIEARSPFLDRRVVDYGMRLPLAAKRRGTFDKALLTAAWRDVLPPWLAERTKKPFTLPVAEWLAGELGARARAVVDDRHGIARELLGRQRIEALFRHPGGGAAARIWALLVLELWYAGFAREIAAPAARERSA